MTNMVITEKRRRGREIDCSQVTVGQTTVNLKYTKPLPGLVEQGFEDLLNDIARRGIIHRVVTDDAGGNVIDSAHQAQPREQC